nr:hypothetical protein [Tanacetum cinerariifolium]
MTNLIQDNKHLEERLDSHGARLYTLENLDIPQQETNSYKAHEDHMMLYEDLENSMNRDHTDELLKDLAEARKKKRKRRDSPKRHLGLHLINHLLLHHQQVHLELQDLLELLDHHKCCHHLLHLHPPTKKTMTDTRLRPSVSSIPEDLHMDDDMAPDAQVHSSNDEDIGNAHIPKVNLRQDWWKPLEEDRPTTPEPAWFIPSSDLPVPKNNWVSALASTYSPPPEDSLLAQTGDMEMFMDWFYKRQGITELKPQDLEGPAFELVKVFHPNVIHLQYQMEECHKLLIDSVDESIIMHNVSKPLPRGGPPGQVTIQSDFFFKKDLEYLRYGSKDSRHALSISKMKAAYYPDVGLEQMVPDQMCIEEECKHTSEGDHRAVRTHVWILSVVRIEVFSMCGDGTLHQIDEVLDYRVKEFKVNRMNLVDVVFNGAFRGVGDEEVVVGEGVVVISSSLDMLINSCLGGIMVSLIFLEGLDEEAFMEFMVEWCEEDEDDDRNKEDDLFN